MKVFCRQCRYRQERQEFFFGAIICKKTAKRVPVPAEDTPYAPKGFYGYKTVYGPHPGEKNAHNDCPDFEPTLTQRITSWISSKLK